MTAHSLILGAPLLGWQVRSRGSGQLAHAMQESGTALASSGEAESVVRIQVT